MKDFMTQKERIMRIKHWKECTLKQKIARVVLLTPLAMATVAYGIVGSYLFYVLVKY